MNFNTTQKNGDHHGPRVCGCRGGVRGGGYLSFLPLFDGHTHEYILYRSHRAHHNRMCSITGRNAERTTGLVSAGFDRLKNQQALNITTTPRHDPCSSLTKIHACIYEHLCRPYLVDSPSPPHFHDFELIVYFFSCGFVCAGFLHLPPLHLWKSFCWEMGTLWRKHTPGKPQPTHSLHCRHARKSCSQKVREIHTAQSLY